MILIKVTRWRLLRAALSTTCSTAVGLYGHVLTTDPRNCPVASDAGGKVRQLEDKGSSVGVCVVIGSSDIDAVDISAHPLTDLRLLGYQRRGVVINIYQIDLQRACATGCRGAWEQKEGRENGIKMGGKDDNMCAVRGTMEEEEGQVPEANNIGGMKTDIKKGKRRGERALFIHNGGVWSRGAVELEENLWPWQKYSWQLCFLSPFSLTVKSSQIEPIIQMQAKHIRLRIEALGTIMMTVTQSNKSLSACI